MERSFEEELGTRGLPPSELRVSFSDAAEASLSWHTGPWRIAVRAGGFKQSRKTETWV